MDNRKLSNLRPHVLQKIEKALSDMSYRDAIENSAKYNNRLVVDRKTRLPFIDSQTGVAQRDCYLWMQRWQRMPGTNYGQLYTYPAHKWKKRRRGYLFRENYYSRSQVNENSGEIQESASSKGNGQDGGGISSMKSDVTTGGREGREAGGGGGGGGIGVGVGSELNQNSSDKFVDSSKDAWMYADYEDSIDLMEEDFEDPASDGDDYDEYSSRRKKRRSRRKKGEQGGDNDKPYACDLCDARYKTRPGLTYHYAHNHNEGEKRSKSSTPVSMIDEDSRASTRNNSSGQNQSGNGSSLNKNPDNKPLATPNPYCDFCLADENEKTTKIQEKMVSCSDCGRSAHPTCLQFTPQMILSVAKYRWQCIECKSCGICGTSDNDEQLLFCDDCDRGYHMYCLTPPISEPPEGSWSCHLCMEEYHKPKNQTECSSSSGKEDKRTEKEKQEKTEESDKQSAKSETNGKDTPAKEETLKMVKEGILEKMKSGDHGKQATDKKTSSMESEKEQKPEKPPQPPPMVEEKLKSILEEKKKETESK